MIQIKEFLNYQEGTENEVNTWLKEMNDKIEIVDIKYSVAAFQANRDYGYEGQKFCGVLVVYKTK